MCMINNYPLISSLCSAIVISWVSCFCQDTRQFIWKEGANPSSNYRYHIALSSVNRIFVVGGDNRGAFEAYDPAANAWTDLPKLPAARMFCSGAVLENTLYVIGGIDDSMKYTSSVEIYPIENNSWSSCRNLPSDISRHASVSYDGKIFVFGGLEGTNDRDCRNSASVFMYNPQKDTWTRKADMPTARHGLSAIVVKNKILVIGGYSDGPTGVVEEYDPIHDQWTTKAPMPTPRGFFGLVNIGDYVYAIGGRIWGEKGPVERYNIDHDQWIQLEPLPVARQRFGIATVHEKVYLIGDEDNPQSVLIGEIQ